MAREKARNILKVKDDELVVTYFGYLTWYKGADIFAKTFAKNQINVDGKKVRFVMAGGESFTQKNKTHYRKFVQGIYASAKDSKQLSISGFVSEKDFPLYFAASDLVVLPYRTFMSSSGPLSLALSFKKPFIMADKLADFAISSDFAREMADAELVMNDITFPLTERKLQEKVKKVLHNGTRSKLKKFVGNLREVRSFDNLAIEYYKLLSPSNSFNSSFVKPKRELAKVYSG